MSARNSSTQETGRRSTLVITNLTKLGGIALGLHAGFQANPDPRVIALAAFMLAGAQVSQTVMLALIERFLGMSPPKGEE